MRRNDQTPPPTSKAITNQNETGNMERVSNTGKQKWKFGKQKVEIHFSAYGAVSPFPAYSSLQIRLLLSVF
jgi:hypothetical protein